MQVHIGTDHAGFELKEQLVAALNRANYQVVDHGASSYAADDDYPQFCIPVGEAVTSQPGSLGIVLGGSGNGEQIAANKVTGVRAALAYTPEIARLARQHNDANVLSLGARFLTFEQAWEITKVFLAEPFSQEPRHKQRIALIAEYEADSSSSQ